MTTSLIKRPAAPHDTATIACRDGHGGFRLEAAQFAAGPRTLLHPLTLDLAPGRIVALVGHNGSGKSTLLKLLARQQPVGAGRILFDGRDLHAWKQRDFARRVAYLPQTPPPAPGLLVHDLVRLGRYPWHGPFGRVGADDRAKIAAALRLTGMEEFADRAVEALSGGERQRAWIAMLVAQDAGCLLLDEPISALDVAHQIEVLQLLRDLARERGVGIVVVLHDINMAARFCDEILALKAGRLVARGTPAEVVTPACLARIYGIGMATFQRPGGGQALAFPL